MMSLTVVRSIDSPRQLATAEVVEDFEQELVDQYALAMAAAGALREDRILQEIHASGGGLWRICDLFGMTIGAAMRHAATLAQTGAEDAQVRRTQTQK